MTRVLQQNHWDAIRRHYAWATPLIMAERRDEWALDPYAWCEDGMIRMTPIEEWLWADLRNANAIIYPQYPIGRYFVDFANPKAKVAIECDGAAYHTDWKKDAARDAELEAVGWTVHRITGSRCRTDSDEETGEPGYAGRFVRDICERHNIARNCTQPTGGRLVSAAECMESVIRMFEAEAQR